MINEQNDDDDDKWRLDIGGLLVTHGTNQLQVSHILTGRSYICLTVMMVSWEEDKDEKLKDNLRHSKLICADVGGGERRREGTYHQQEGVVVGS